MHNMEMPVYVVIPNLNGGKDLARTMESVLAQSHKNLILIVVDNNSTDNSREIIEHFKAKDARVRSIYQDKNYGFTGGMNPGLAVALAEKAKYVAGCNNDARPHQDWLKHMVKFLNNHPIYGIAACKMLLGDGKKIDSTGEQYTIWGLAYPRGRDEPAGKQYDQQTEIFGASGGASLYRVAMLEQIGLFDQDFFAYYEDADLSFRAQLTSWKVAFVPQSVVYHDQGKTAKRMHSGFTTYQTMKNLPFIIIKDLPLGLWYRVLPRFVLVYALLFFKALASGRGGSVLRGIALFWLKFPKKLIERQHIQKMRTVSNTHIWNLLVHDLPPGAQNLRKLRAWWWKLTGRAA